MDHSAHHGHDAAAGHTAHGGSAATAGNDLAMAAMHGSANSVNHGAHDRHAGHSVAMFLDRFWLTLALTVPVIVWSPDSQTWLGHTAPVLRARP